MTYLQSGGSDHNILSQLYELQVEATALEKAGMRSERKGRKKSKLFIPAAQPFSNVDQRFYYVIEIHNQTYFFALHLDLLVLFTGVETILQKNPV